jgi:hypothetical protein
MERNFTNENMEEFLRQNADALRMRPSPGVWKGISKHLNRRRRTLGYILGTALLVTSALGYYLLNEVPGHVSSSTPNTPAKIQKRISEQTSGTLNPAENSTTANGPLTVNKAVAPQQFFADELSDIAATASGLNTGEQEENLFTPTVVDSYFETALHRDGATTESKKAIATDPLTIESVLNSFKPKTKARLTWQTYFTPTISYRKLNDPTIDYFATHKPAFGFEVGTAAKYPVSKNVKLRAGLQFNVNRYEIKTNETSAQLATIRLNDGNRVNSYTSYSNVSGYKSSWIKNFYFQISAPVGLEFKIKGDDKVQFGVASTIQPTYLLGDRTYLISSDYKNYILANNNYGKMPNLVRRWNVNTDVQTFVAYSTGHLNWQVGPQVRYQILSSYLKKYPVKENLFDFGLKVGISVNKQ